MSEFSHQAMLVRGNVYFLGNKRFDHGKPVKITKAEYDHLKEHAVDHFSVENEKFSKAKFEFEKLSADGEAVQEPPKRSRKKPE